MTKPVTNTESRAVGSAGGDLIARLAFGAMAAQTLRAAVRLRVVELIGAESRRAADVAAGAGAQPQAVTRLLRALTGLGLLEEDSPDTFSVTPAGALLDPGAPDALTSFVRIFTDPAVLRSWEYLDDSVRSGERAFDGVFGTDFFSHLALHTELSEEFHAAMGQATAQAAAVLPHAVDFGRFSRVTDVGGGDGTLLAGILGAHPGLTGTVFDTSEGLIEAARTVRRHRLEERCSLVAGDFFRGVPAGSDLYLMKSVLHDWRDDQVVTILRHCREALPSGGLVLIVEPVLPEVVDTDPGAAATDGGITYLSDLNMLVNIGGRERTRTDFDDVCHRAGLRLMSVTPLREAAPFSVLEAAAG